VIPTNNDDQVMEILGQAKALAQRYRALTGKPLGITGEVAEFEAARRIMRPRGHMSAAGGDWDDKAVRPTGRPAAAPGSDWLDLPTHWRHQGAPLSARFRQAQRRRARKNPLQTLPPGQRPLPVDGRWLAGLHRLAASSRARFGHDPGPIRARRREHAVVPRQVSAGLGHQRSECARSGECDAFPA
jgi:hypothetical protein